MVKENIPKVINLVTGIGGDNITMLEKNVVKNIRKELSKEYPTSKFNKIHGGR